MAKKETIEERQYREMVEGIATGIAKLSRQVDALLTGRLKRKTIIVLLAKSSGYPQNTVDNILSAIQSMEKTYLKD